MGEDLHILTRVAYLYYAAGLNQAEIAARLGVSRQTVGRAIRRSRELGIVKIQIDSPHLLSAELEGELERRFGIKEAVVCKAVDGGESGMKEALGLAASRLLQKYLADNQTVGISWGSTILQCISNLPQLDVRDLTVVQLDGSTNVTPYPTNAEHIVHRLAELSHGVGVTLPAPLFVDSIDIRNRLITDSRIAHALGLGRKADIAVVGIGEISRASNLYRTGYLDDALLMRLTEANAVGDVCGRFYDMAGRVCLTDLDERTISVELEDLRSKRISIAIAGGRGKSRAILGALEGRLCNVIVTDESAALDLLGRSATEEQ